MRPSNARVAPMSAGGRVPSKSFINKYLLHLRNCPRRPNSVLRFHFGTVTKLNRELSASHLAASPVRPSSRTPVTGFSASPRYRFSGALTSNSVDAHPPQQADHLADFEGRSRRLPDMFSCGITDSLGGHTSGVTNGYDQHVLLPLRGVKRAQRLRKDV